MNPRFEIKTKNCKLHIDSSHLYLSINDDKTYVKIALEDLIMTIRYLASKITITKNLTD